MHRKILLTGFCAFDGDQDNPSAQWLHWMKRHTLNNDQIKYIELQVSFEKAFLAFKDIFDEYNPDIVILTGLAKNRKDLSVERIGINWVDARIPDNDGVKFVKQKIDSLGPDGIFTRIPFDPLITLCELMGVPLKISTSAGEYVCNDLLYKALLYTESKKTPMTFFHLPGRNSLIEYEEIFLALSRIVDELLKS